MSVFKTQMANVTNVRKLAAELKKIDGVDGLNLEICSFYSICFCYVEKSFYTNDRSSFVSVNVLPVEGNKTHIVVRFDRSETRTYKSFSGALKSITNYVSRRVKWANDCYERAKAERDDYERRQERQNEILTSLGIPDCGDVKLRRGNLFTTFFQGLTEGQLRRLAKTKIGKELLKIS